MQIVHIRCILFALYMRKKKKERKKERKKNEKEQIELFVSVFSSRRRINESLEVHKNS